MADITETAPKGEGGFAYSVTCIEPLLSIPFGLKPLFVSRISYYEWLMSSDAHAKQFIHATTVGISLGTFVIVVAVSLGYYQFVYVPPG